MDIDTDWCLNCGKQTNGELYCSSQCRSQDEKASRCGSYSSDFESDCESLNSAHSNGFTSKCINNPDKLLYSRLKFKNRPNYETGYYSPCLSSGLSQWLNQNVKMMTSQEQSRKTLLSLGTPQSGHKHHHHQLGLTNGFKGTYSSSPSESSYTSSSETMSFGSNTSSNNYLNQGFAVKKSYYPWNKVEEDEDISLYEY